MNIALVATFIAVVFAGLKIALTYKSLNLKAVASETVVCYVSAAAGIYLYETYSPKHQPAALSVFTEPPAF